MSECSLREYDENDLLDKLSNEEGAILNDRIARFDGAKQDLPRNHGWQRRRYARRVLEAN